MPLAAYLPAVKPSRLAHHHRRPRLRSRSHVGKPPTIPASMSRFLPSPRLTLRQKSRRAPDSRRHGPDHRGESSAAPSRTAPVFCHFLNEPFAKIEKGTHFGAPSHRFLRSLLHCLSILYCQLPWHVKPPARNIHCACEPPICLCHAAESRPRARCGMFRPWSYSTDNRPACIDGEYRGPPARKSSARHPHFPGNRLTRRRPGNLVSALSLHFSRFSLLSWLNNPIV